MIKKIKNFAMVAMMALSMGAPVLAPAVVYADNINNALCAGANAATDSTGSCTTTNPNGDLKNVAANIVNLLSVIVGIVSVIMIIYGGFKYITSGGDSGNVSGAKNTLIYAIIGLIIVALAQFIVHFVLSAANNTGLTS